VGEGIGTGVTGDPEVAAPDFVASVEIVGDASAGCDELKVGEGRTAPNTPAPATTSAASRSTTEKATATAGPRRLRVAWATRLCNRRIGSGSCGGLVGSGDGSLERPVKFGSIDKSYMRRSNRGPAAATKRAPLRLIGYFVAQGLSFAATM
jgi:hypothetical protein